MNEMNANTRIGARVEERISLASRMAGNRHTRASLPLAKRRRHCPPAPPRRRPGGFSFSRGAERGGAERSTNFLVEFIRFNKQSSMAVKYKCHF